MIKDFLFDLVSRMKWSVSRLSIVALLFALAIWPIASFANSSWFTENGVLENLQLFVLSCTLFVCVKAQNCKKLFYMFAMIVVLLIMRETNIGRQYFCDKYLNPDELCRWKSMKYGFIVEPLRLLFGVYIVWFAWVNKLHLDFIKYLKNAPIFMIGFVLLISGAVLGSIAEMSFIDNEILEECGEMLFYLALQDCLWRYGKVDMNKIK